MLLRYNTNTGKLAVYKNAQEAGSQMPVYATQEELYKSPATTAELTYFYNSITGASLKSFKTKGDGVKRIFKVLENGYNGELSANERVNPNGEELGAPESYPEALGADAELSAQGSGESREVSQEGSSEARKAPNGADQEAEASESDRRATGTSNGGEATQEPEAEKAVPGASGEASVRKGRGRKAALSGKRLVATVDKNPRRANGRWHQSFQLILDAGPDGLPYEDYLAAGGHTSDLRAHIGFGIAKVID